MERLLIALFLILFLTGCAGQTVPDTDGPTLPTLSQTVSVEDQLRIALEKTRSADSLTLTFGVDQDLRSQQVADREDGYISLLESGTGAVFHTGALRYRQTGTEAYLHTADAPFSREEIFREAMETVPNPTLIAGFCDGLITASPSDDGSFRFHRTELSLEELYLLIHGHAPDVPLGDYPEAVCAASITVDAQGYLTALRFDAYLTPDDRHSLILTVEAIGSTCPQTPAWVTGGTFLPE